MARIVKGDGVNLFDIRGFEFKPEWLKLSANGKSYVFAPKLEIDACDLTFTDGENKSYPLVLANAASIRLPFMTPNDLAAEMIADEVIERKNIDRRAKGEKVLLSNAAKKRNRLRKAAQKWHEDHPTRSPFANVVFSELLLDKRNEYIEENSEARIDRKLKSMAKRHESGVFSQAECEAAIIQLRFLLGRFDEGTAAYNEVVGEIKRLTDALNAAQAAPRDVTGANLLSTTTLEEHLAADGATA